MNILGISAFYHDSAAALTINGRIVAAAQEERFTRKKHDPGFPTQAIIYCLEQGGLSISELDAIVFYDKPYLKFERLMETYYGFAPRGLRSFWAAIPVWIREKLFLKKVIRDEIKKIGHWDRKKTKFLFPDHHLSHAASAFYPSPYEKAAILTLDGVGEWATASIAVGEGNKIKVLRELRFPHSLGLLYTAFTYFLGFRVNSGEYKLMGLAPYGNPHSERVRGYVATIRSELIDIKDDGSIWLNQKYFNYATGLRMVFHDKWEKLFGMPKREPESPLEQQHCDLGLAIQLVTEEVVLRMAKTAQELTGAQHLCMAGGVALNCVANGKLQQAGIFEDVFIQPAAGDAGGALGAALAAHSIHFGAERKRGDVADAAVGKAGKRNMDAMRGAYLGPEYSGMDIERMARRFKAPFERFDDFGQLAEKVAGLIADGNAVGWFQGRMEFGPRALGNRSILGDARNPEMQKKLNLKIKFRESFRPFAPSVLEEDVAEYFDYEGISPYMLLVHPVHPDRQKQLPANYHDLPIKEKLYFQRSDLPAITHIDFSARIQTVSAQTNPRYHQLIAAFKQQTGFGLVVNTSFNVRGEPIVCTPTDAYTCLMRTEMDYLVVGDYLFAKTAQPAWKEDRDWREEFALD
ncbi:MAG: carbamoyltransferase [Bacteroidota bacterium]